MPIPKAIVATIILTSSSIKSFCVSVLLFLSSPAWYGRAFMLFSFRNEEISSV
jgi:hypothetical protein